MTDEEPRHKCSLSFGVQSHCSCGWRGAARFDAAARAEALEEWRRHALVCSALERAARDAELQKGS